MKKGVNAAKFGIIVLALSIVIITVFYLGVLVGAHVIKLTENQSNYRSVQQMTNNNHLRKGYKLVDAFPHLINETQTVTLDYIISISTKHPISTFIKAKHSSFRNVPVSTRMSLPRSPLPPPPQHSIEITEDSYVITPTNLDNTHILIGAWVYLNDIPSSNMRTIFSNKATGCENMLTQYGLALFVNAWETSDQILYLEYGNKDNGCNKISSNIQIKSSRWYHIAVYMSPEEVIILIDGHVVTHETQIKGHEIQANQPFLFGHYEGNKYPLYGNISHITIAHGIDLNAYLNLNSSTGKSSVALYIEGYVQKHIMPAGKAIAPVDEHMVACYPLRDTSSIVHESTHHYDGRYIHPVDLSSAVRVPGIPFPLIDGLSTQPYPQVVTPAENEAYVIKCAGRRDQIRDGMRFVWSNYHEYAWGSDELKPISRSRSNNWGSMGMTILDSIDTLYIMGLKTEFAEAVQWIQQTQSFHHAGLLSVFEVTIRALGGLLSAYDLSKDAILLQKAMELGDILLPAFDTQTGIPYGQINFATRTGQDSWNGHHSLIAELGTMQLEFRALSYYSKNPVYEAKAMRPLQLMYQKHPTDGLYPMKVSIHDGSFTDSKVTVGAMGDSFYEYLLKTWLQGGRRETWLREMYDKAIDGIVTNMLSRTSKSGYLYVADYDLKSRGKNHKMDHLVCFLPGILALGAYTNPDGDLDSSRSKRDLAVAKALMLTCRMMYHFTPTGISPEYVDFPTSGNADLAINPQAAFYILRPETAESLFVLAQLTGESIYREWAWEIWSAIDTQCKVDGGYASLHDVRTARSVEDRMESFFLAETMKYLYLAQDTENTVDLMKVVLNTEAHPISIFDSSHISISSG